MGKLLSDLGCLTLHEQVVGTPGPLQGHLGTNLGRSDGFRGIPDRTRRLADDRSWGGATGSDFNGIYAATHDFHGTWGHIFHVLTNQPRQILNQGNKLFGVH